MNTQITTPQVQDIELSFFGPQKASEMTTKQLDEIAEERRQICYQRYLQNVANKPAISYDKDILLSLYEIVYYITNGLLESFKGVFGSVNYTVEFENEEPIIKINTPNSCRKIDNDSDLLFAKLNIKTLERILGAKVVKELKSILPVETPKSVNVEVFEIGKSSCKKLSAIQIKNYTNLRDYKTTYVNVNYPYWKRRIVDGEMYFHPVNAVDFKINLDYFKGFEFFATEYKTNGIEQIIVSEKITGLRVIECRKSELSNKLNEIADFQKMPICEIIKSSIKDLPFEIEEKETIQSINAKRIAQNEIYVFETEQPVTNEENEENEENEIETETNQEPTNETETMQPTTQPILEELPLTKKELSVLTWTESVNSAKTDGKTIFFYCDGLLFEGLEMSVEGAQISIDAMYQIEKEQKLTVGQVIQCEGYRLIVTAVKEAKQNEVETMQEPTFKIKETKKGKWVFENKNTFVSFDLGKDRVSGSDLTDRYNELRFYNKTSRSIKKALEAMKNSFNETTTMYGAMNIMDPFIRTRSYCSMD